MNNENLNNKDIITPVLLGADLNCYNVARAFHEAYGVVSYAFGRYPIGVTRNTRIIKFRAVDDLDNPDILISELKKFAAEHDGKKLILLGCTDDYAALIIKNKNQLPKNYIIPYIDAALMEDITLKERFYGYCDKYSLPYPRTVIYGKGQPFDIMFEYPIIIKPSSSVLYWKYPFEGMKKVYRAHSREEAEKIIAEIYSSGYPEKLIIQDMIPGDDSMMYTMTAYCDREGSVRMMCLGHVLLEEHTPKGLGNHAAIITDYNEALSQKLKKFLEDIKYTGFANFDIKYDVRDGIFKLFEINVRQGRSNFYVTAAGMNIARYIVDDYVYNKPYDGCFINKNIIYWRYIPDCIVYRYSDAALCERVKALKKAKKAYSSLWYAPDLFFNLKRVLFILLHEYRHIGKYKTYYNKDEMK
jgi:D-aspartate ligase